MQLVEETFGESLFLVEQVVHTLHETSEVSASGAGLNVREILTERGQ